MNSVFLHIPLLMGAPDAAGGQGGSGSLVTTFITFGLIIVVFYFLMIRPQNKKQKEAQRMLNSLKKGDKVATIGGIRGTVVSVKEQTVVIKVDDNTKIEFSKSAVSSVIEAREREEKEEKTEKKPSRKGSLKLVRKSEDKETNEADNEENGQETT